jgi:hypothetical protein
MTEYRDFLSTIWGELTGQVAISRMIGDELKNHKFFSWPEMAEDIYAYIEKYKHEDVYYTPVLFKAPKRQRAVAGQCQVVYGDADDFDLTQIKAEPSVIVHTSDNKTHLYWLLTDVQDAQTCETLSHSVSVEHPKKTTGFDDGWSATKLLRVPGTRNLKYSTEGEEGYLVNVEYTGVVYSTEEFTEFYPAVPDIEYNFTPFPESELPSYAEALGSIRTSVELEDLLSTQAYEKNSSGSEALYRLECELFRLGATDEVAFVICERSNLNKFKRDGHRNPGELLWNDIQRARAKEGITIEGDEEEDSEDTVITVHPKPKPKGFDFLTAYEKERLDRTFIDEYLTWATAKTDAAPQYHIAGAFTVLACIFADFGHAVPKWGALQLNLWFMVLGSTTLSRKSTTKSLMMQCIEALEAENYNYDLGSKFTAEGLDEALRAGANRSALLHVDEIQGFMKTVDTKAYMAGIKAELTEVYDGKVTGKLRASGEEKDKKRKGAKVALNMFTMAIKDQLADYLSIEDFQSGFLTRFVYVNGTAAQRTKESDYVPQMNVLERKQGDPVFNGMIEKLKEARDMWEGWADPNGATISVPCTEEAWERWNRFITDALDAAQAQSKAQVLEAAASRLNNSVLKAATLLAMADCCDEVQLKHMLVAINYCGQWFEHLVEMTNRISESDWKRQQDRLTEFLGSKGGEASWELAYRQFNSEMRHRQFLELVQSMEEAGQLLFQKDKKKRTLTLIEGY